MAKVIIFGLRDFASLAHFYLTHDSPHRVAAFTVTKEYLPAEPTFEGVPIVPFETLEISHPVNEEYQFFAPMSQRGMNRQRELIYTQAKAKGYPCISYVSSKATVFPGTNIGDNCFILEDNTIQPFAQIGNNVILWSGNHIGHHCTISDHVFFTSHVVLSGHCTVEPYCFFGVNATIRDRLKLAIGSLISLGSCVTHDTEPWGVYRGNPARKTEVLSKDIDF